jgi:hypothetical protein
MQSAPVMTDELTEVAYPPAPWQMTGLLWMGAFPTDAPVPLPVGLQPLLSSHLAMLTLVRYQAGTLQYDELVVGTLARRGWRVGIWVDHIWVDSLPSVWGGRRLWGLPKNMAVFAWEGNTVQVSDEAGVIATVTVKTTPSALPAIWMPAPGFGLIDEQLVFTWASLWVSLGRSGLQVSDWSARFPYKLKRSTPAFVLAAKPFQMTVPASKRL